MTEYKRWTKRNEDGTYSIVGDQLDEVVKKRNKQEPKPLIEQIEGTQWLVDFVDKFDCAERNALLCCQKLGEIEDKMEQGLMIELPCKMYETVWEVLASATWSFRNGKWYRDYYINKTRFFIEDYHKVGDTIFLTKAEAEAKLRELQGDKQ